jgi:hypothetical protein
MRPVALIGGERSDDARLSRLVDALNSLQLGAYLVARPGNSATKDARCLFDVHGDFQRMYGMSGEFLCLIRPDDHVGLIQRPIDEASLRAYLEMICPPDAVARAIV